MSTTDFISIDNAMFCDCKKGFLSCIEARDWMSTDGRQNSQWRLFNGTKRIEGI